VKNYPAYGRLRPACRVAVDRRDSLLPTSWLGHQALIPIPRSELCNSARIGLRSGPMDDHSPAPPGQRFPLCYRPLFALGALGPVRGCHAAAQISARDQAGWRIVLA
jgi:hypothetical protein